MTESKQELLALAAKAHGYIDDATSDSTAHDLHKEIADDQDGGDVNLFYWLDSDGWGEWNPYTNKGQLYELAKALRLSVDFDMGVVYGQGAEYQQVFDDASQTDVEAIMMVAAEIGRAM